MGSGKGSLDGIGIKISGTGEVTPGKIDIVEGDKPMDANPMEKIAEESNDTQHDVAKEAVQEQQKQELPQEIIDAASKVGKLNLAVEPTDAVEDESGYKMAAPDDKPQIVERDDPTPTISEKDGYNPNTVGDPRKGETDNDGGVAPSRSKDGTPDGGVKANESTGKTGGTDGVDNQNGKSDMDTNSLANKYELTGFTIQYKEEDSNDVISTNIREYYNSKEDAMGAVKEFKYTMKNGIEANITSGAPIICFNEREILHHTDENWRNP